MLSTISRITTRPRHSKLPSTTLLAALVHTLSELRVLRDRWVQAGSSKMADGSSETSTARGSRHNHTQHLLQNSRKAQSPPHAQPGSHRLLSRRTAGLETQNSRSRASIKRAQVASACSKALVRRRALTLASTVSMLFWISRRLHKQSQPLEHCLIRTLTWTSFCLATLIRKARRLPLS